MNRKSVNHILNRLAILYHVGTISLAGFAFATPFFPNPDHPTNQAGLYAALVALCMGGLIFAETISWGRLKIQKIRRFAIGFCALGSSYLWLVSENKSDPIGFELPLGILLIWFLSLAVVAIPYIFLYTKPPHQSNGDC